MLRQLKMPRSIVAMAAAALIGMTSPAWADEWNERTELTITEPIMVPGATLQPGTYVFELADFKGNRHFVRIFDKSDNSLVTQTMAVPVKRLDVRGDTMLSLNPTDWGTPALKAWYYPGSTYGHEFVYSEEQAKHIAERSKTIVLSIDLPDSDLEKGTLSVYHPTGSRTAWQSDPSTEREWQDWQRARAMVRSDDDAEDQENGGDEPSGPNNGDDAGDREPDARAPMMMTGGSAMKADLGDIEDNPSKFLDKVVSVDAKVDDVYGPRLFTVDEGRFLNLGGEVLVYAPSMLAALVREDDRVTVTGTIKSVAIAEIEKEWGWFGLDPDIEVEFMKKPVLVADRIVGGDNEVAMFIEMNPNAGTPSGDDSKSSGKSTTAGGNNTVMDLGTVSAGTTDLVGRRVDLKNVKVLNPARDGGFFIDAPSSAVFVLPGHNLSVTVAPGDELHLRGVIATTPDDMGQRLSAPTGWNDQIYVVATSVSKQ